MMSGMLLKRHVRKVARHICEFTGHQRSRAKARRLGYRWISECKLCGVPLERVGPKFWVETKLVDKN